MAWCPSISFPLEAAVFSPAALLLRLSLDLRKHPPVTTTQRGIVLPSLAQHLTRAVLEAGAGVSIIPI